MASSSESYHESLEVLTEETRDMHRALVSLQEELEAVDWYRQRADACKDNELRKILLHNMREEVEHASMVLEWLRRNSTDFAEKFDTYLYTTAPITEIEEIAEKTEQGIDKNGGRDETPNRAPERSRPGWTVGSLKEE